MELKAWLGVTGQTGLIHAMYRNTIHVRMLITIQKIGFVPGTINYSFDSHLMLITFDTMYNTNCLFTL